MQFKFAFMKLRSFGKCRRRRPADGGGLGARRWWAFVAHLVQLLVLGSGEDRRCEWLCEPVPAEARPLARRPPPIPRAPQDDHRALSRCNPTLTGESCPPLLQRGFQPWLC